MSYKEKIKGDAEGEEEESLLLRTNKEGNMEIDKGRQKEINQNKC